MTGQCLFAEMDSRKLAANIQNKAARLQAKNGRHYRKHGEKESVLRHLIQSLKKFI
jgi:hypothetical protein